MLLTRRRFIEVGCVAASAPLWSACGDDSAPGSVEDALASDFQRQGFAEVEPQPLEASYAFNEGHRYDEYPMRTAGSRSFVVQSCRRLEDQDGDGIVVRPEFRMIVWASSPAMGIEASTRLLLEEMTGTLGLDPVRIAAVTADDFLESLRVLPAFGIGPDQVFIRPAASARAQGDGSGYFGPEGYPGPRYSTIAFNYSREAPVAGRVDRYPLPLDMVEIGEAAVAGGGMGIERAAWASGSQGAGET